MTITFAARGTFGEIDSKIVQRTRMNGRQLQMLEIYWHRAWPCRARELSAERRDVEAAQLVPLSKCTSSCALACIPGLFEIDQIEA